MSISPPEHQEGTEGVVPSQEDATEGGVGTGRLRKVLLRGDTGVVVVLGGDLGIVGANVAEARGNSCGVPETGDKVEGIDAEGRFMEEGRG